MKITIEKKHTFIIKGIILGIVSLIWFVFIQVEYEIITRPELQNEFPIIKGFNAVLCNGIFVLSLSVIIFLLLLSMKKHFP